MHELAIAESVVDIAVRHAAGRRVTRVELEVGHLRQVVPAALEFAFELVARGTPVEGAELSMREVRAAGRCRSCGADTELPGFPLACGSCGGFDVEVTRGEELRVDSLELDEALTTTQSLRSGPSPLFAQDGG
jgi:hydrogenase nickel incorporation protein HypA/HybF